MAWACKSWKQEEGPKPNKASADDEFLRRAHSHRGFWSEFLNLNDLNWIVGIAWHLFYLIPSNPRDWGHPGTGAFFRNPLREKATPTHWFSSKIQFDSAKLIEQRQTNQSSCLWESLALNVQWIHCIQCIGTVQWYSGPIEKQKWQYRGEAFSNSPFLLFLPRYDFNCLDDALQTWHCQGLSTTRDLQRRHPTLHSH